MDDEFKRIYEIVTGPFAKARKLTVKTEIKDPSTEVKQKGYLNISFGKDLTVLVLHPNSQYIKSVTSLKDVISKIASDEIIVAVGLATLTKKEQLPGIRMLFGGIFITNILEHSSVPKHVIMSESEATSFLDSQRLSKSDLPIINWNDPVSVWLGASPKQLIKITGPSNTAASAISVRQVGPKIHIRRKLPILRIDHTR